MEIGWRPYAEKKPFLEVLGVGASFEGLDLGEHGMHAWDVNVGGSQFDAPPSFAGDPERAPAGALATES